jgi:hypothetical protein
VRRRHSDASDAAEDELVAGDGEAGLVAGRAEPVEGLLDRASLAYVVAAAAGQRGKPVVEVDEAADVHAAALNEWRHDAGAGFDQGREHRIEAFGEGGEPRFVPGARVLDVQVDGQGLRLWAAQLQRRLEGERGAGRERHGARPPQRRAGCTGNGVLERIHASLGIGPARVSQLAVPFSGSSLAQSSSDLRARPACFSALLAEYSKAPEVTRRRIYVETMQGVMAGLRAKVIIDEHARSVLPLLQLDAAQRTAQQPAAP